MVDRPFLSESEARDLTRRVLALSGADQCRVNLSSNLDGNTRFAQNQMSTTGDVTNATLTVTSAFGARVASSTTNRFDEDSLREVVETSERLARLAPEDPEYLGEMGSQRYPEVSSFYDSTADLEPAERARAIASVTDQAVDRDLVSTGFLVHRAGASVVATSEGLFVYRTDSRVNFTTTVRTPDGTGSGWAGTSTNDWADLDTGPLGEVAVRKAEMSRDPRDVEPGRWTVVMEPTAVGNMVGLMMNQLGARAAHEGRMDTALMMGGNLYAATPNSEWAAEALERIGFKVFLTTTLNRGHFKGVGRGEALVLPVTARDEEWQATEADEPVPPGKHQVRVEFAYDGMALEV
jgi:predicted Zn-dependent protease